MENGKIVVQCACGKRLRTDATNEGNTAVCPSCGGVLSIWREGEEWQATVYAAPGARLVEARSSRSHPVPELAKRKLPPASTMTVAGVMAMLAGGAGLVLGCPASGATSLGEGISISIGALALFVGGAVLFGCGRIINTVIDIEREGGRTQGFMASLFTDFSRKTD